MIHYCPKCVFMKYKLIWQPAKRRFYCQKCHLNFSLLEVAFVKGGKA